MKKIHSRNSGRESEASILGNDREREFPLTPASGAIALYWAPESGCTLVKWQTAYSALVEGDYNACMGLPASSCSSEATTGGSVVATTGGSLATTTDSAQTGNPAGKQLFFLSCEFSATSVSFRQYMFRSLGILSS